MEPPDRFILFSTTDSFWAAVAVETVWVGSTAGDAIA